MKNLTIILLLISTIAYGQSDTLVMESVTYDTLITVKVVKKTMVEKTVNGRKVTDVTNPTDNGRNQTAEIRAWGIGSTFRASKVKRGSHRTRSTENG